MLISYNWLKDYVDFDFSPQELAHKLINLGFETANLEKIGDDTIIDLELTINRGDCLSMVGMAREIAAMNHTQLKIPSPPSFNLSKRLKKMITVSLVEPKLCPRYTGRIIDRVKISPSPSWICERLEKVGINSINNVVDITNFVMMELGHPLHAFDYHTLIDNKVIICRATAGEKITALNGVTYELSPEMLIIADAEKPIALAGIIGGVESSVKEDTTTVFLECAYFDPTNVRQTARHLGLQTESSYRFERGVDPEGLIRAQDRATQLIVEICKGKDITEIIDEYPKKFKKTIIDLIPNRINRVLGTNIKKEEVEDILQPLGFGIKQEDKSLQVEVPSFRHLDISREIDLIEEIARVYGYDKIPTSLPAGSFKVTIDRKYELANKAKEILVSCGFYEIITYSFTSPALLLKTKIPLTNQEVVIDNPLREDENLMCPSLIPNILSILSWNINRDNYDLKIFELGRVFSIDVEKVLPKEKEVLIGAIAGNYHEANWRDKTIFANLYDLKGVVEKLLLELGISKYEILAGEHPSLHPARQVKLIYQGVTFGIIGELHPDIAQELKLPRGIYLFELKWDDILNWVNLERRFKPLPRYPAVQRDIAVLIKEDVNAAQVNKIIEDVGKELIVKVRLFDLYQGDKIPQGYKSLAYSVTYRKPDATLTDEEVNEVHNKIILELKNTLGAELREA
ncbi:MAG: phenylalanine--tRNA ligase subunit beta [bacterium]